MSYVQRQKLELCCHSLELKVKNLYHADSQGDILVDTKLKVWGKQLESDSTCQSKFLQQVVAGGRLKSCNYGIVVSFELKF